MSTALPISSILVEDRQRTDLGDINSLAESISRYGLIQPIVVTQDKRLVAGGRRLAACTSLGLSHIEVVYRENLSEEDLTELELEENIRRKDMDWKEKCRAIAKVHRLHVAKGLGNDEEAWTYQRTGELLGTSLANVGYAMVIAKELAHPDSGIHSCATFTDAIRYLAQKKEDAALAELRRRSESKMKLTATTAVDNITSTEVVVTPLTKEEAEKPLPEGTHTIPLSRLLVNANCLDYLRSCPSGSFDHCITDPPYGIDMDNLAQDQGGTNVDRVRETHIEAENRQLLDDFIPLIYQALRPHSFLAMWCDIMLWQTLYNRLTEVGFRVQRWPVIWKKTSTCSNQAAQYNFTKDFEICIIAGREKAILNEKSSTSFVVASRADYISNPFAKPFEVWDFLVKHLTYQGQLIIDPFCGEGSSLKSFISHWRQFIGVEVDPKHYNVALDEVKKKLDLLYRKPNYI